MGMSNDEIDALMNGDTIAEEENSEQANPDEATEELPPEALAISQDEMDSLLATFVSDEETADHESLLEELHEAILDSGRLTLMQWVRLREKLREIEELIPHVDFIIKLKNKAEKSRTDHL